MDCLIYCITTLIISVSLFYVYAKYKLSYWSRRGVKTPPTHLIFGNFKDCLTFNKPPSDVLEEIYNSADPNDPYIGFYIFHKPMLLLRDRNLIKQVMISDFEVFPNRRFGSSNQKDVINLYSILSIQQPRWRYLRRKLTPLLTGQKLKTMLPLMVECGKNMFNFIEKLPTNEHGWNKCEVKNIAGRYVADIMSSTMFGIHTNSFDEMENAFWKQGVDFFHGFKRGVVFIIYFYIPEWAPLIAPFIKGFSKYIRKIFWHSMNEREKMGCKRGDMVDFMLALKNEEQNPIYKFEGDNLLAHPGSFYIAGLEASSTAIAFALYELARQPEYQTVLYNEIQTHLSGKELTIDLINDMSFLDCVIAESLRLHPPLTIVDRIPIKDYKLPSTELIIEKDVAVYISINATNQDPKYFSNPKDFVPLRSKSDDKKFFESLAFGIGPRSCIGQRWGLLITKIALITILLNFSLSYEESKSISSSINVFTQTVNGLHVQFHKRQKVSSVR